MFWRFQSCGQQVSGNWDARDANLNLIQVHVQKISVFFEGCELKHVPRAENEAPDALSKLGSSRAEVPPGVSLEHLRKPSIIPSPESESIYLPPEPGSAATPMEIDFGKTSVDPGTSSIVPGTEPSCTGTTSSDPGTSLAMQIEVMMTTIQAKIDEVFEVRAPPDWGKSMLQFMTDGTLPADEVSARQIQRRSKAYTIINGELYKRSVTGVL